MTRRHLVAIVASALALTSASVGRAQAQSSRAPHEGIQVHGRWTITVRNADGSVASRTEFDNALLPSGIQHLARLVGDIGRAPSGSLDLWRVTLGGSSETYQLYEGTALPEELKRPTDFEGMTVAVPTSGPNANRIQFAGTARATANNTITSVSTAIARIIANGRLEATPFTGHTPATPLAVVVAGQIVEVTVIVSFVPANP